MLVSICIPSYNRPQELSRLLDSIDYADPKALEIVICEDKSPKRAEVRDMVNNFISQSPYSVKYIENVSNYGYDRNLRECISHAEGEWIIFMGDDDIFLPGVLEGYFDFLSSVNAGYVLRAYRTTRSNGKVEDYKYYQDTRYFDPSPSTYVELFRKSVFISGFTFRSEYAQGLLTDRFDGGLLFQLYIQAEICMKYPAAYYGTPITHVYEGGVPWFGSSEAEKDFHTPGKITVENSVNFIKSFFVITEYMDEKYGIASTDDVKKDMSKYSYPILAQHINKSRKEFREYHQQLKELGINKTFHYSVYYFGLRVFGKSFCNRLIQLIKKVLGRTPRL